MSGNRNTDERSLALDELFVRASMSVRTAQALRTFPVVAISLIAVEYSLHDRVNSLQLHAWELAMAVATALRAILCSHIKKTLPTASRDKLRQFEIYLWVSATLNALAVGSSFWLVAANGDLTVRLVMTLISCFYAIGALVNASSHFAAG